jgi:hypothetical protein
VLVSGFAFGGIPEKAIKIAFVETDIYVSPSLLKEYREAPLVLSSEDIGSKEILGAAILTAVKGQFPLRQRSGAIFVRLSGFAQACATCPP